MDELLDIEKAAKFLGVKKSWLRSAIFKKQIKFIKLKRLIRFRMADLLEYVETNTQK